MPNKKAYPNAHDAVMALIRYVVHYVQPNTSGLDSRPSAGISEALSLLIKKLGDINGYSSSGVQY